MTDKDDKVNQVQKHDDNQPGTSLDARIKDILKRTSKKQRFQTPEDSDHSLNRVHDKKDPSKGWIVSKDRNTHQGPHRCRSSADQNLKYKIYTRPKGQNLHQPSQLIKSLEINPKRNEISKFIHQRKLSLISSFTDLTRDHQNDALYRPLYNLFHRRESLVELKKFKRPKRDRIVEKKPKAIKPYIIKRRHRCRSCLYSVSFCDCHLPQDEEVLKEKKSDWAVLSQRQTFDGFVEPSTWTRKRIGWLEEIEANTEYDLLRLHNKVAVEHEVCCFPFSTIGLFGKLNKRVVDYYRKEPK